MNRGNREMMTISLTPDTKRRLKTYAEQKHRSVSQLITDWIWEQPVNTQTEENTEMEKNDD